MSTQHYVEYPHLEIQRALVEARRQGATKATITMDHPSKTATLQDNPHGEEPCTHTFNINPHQTRRHFSETDSNIRDHPAPEGLETTLVSRYFESQEYSKILHSIDHLLLTRGTTPDGRYRISITGRRRNFPVIVGDDGASNILNPFLFLHSIKETDSREPGTPVQTTELGVIIQPLHQGTGNRLGTEDMVAVTKTIAKLTADHIQEREASSPGYVWPNRELREFIFQHDPLARTMPDAQSVSDYQTPGDQRVRWMTTCLTPKNAVFCDYDSVQSSLLNHAVRNHAPRNVIPVNTSDPNVHTIRLLKAEVENLDGTTTEYPVHLWHMQARSGRYDNHAVPSGKRLPHSRVERVKKVSLTMEIRQHQTRETDVFTFDTDVYADQDRKHHLLLVTQDASVSWQTLEDIAYLHSPRYDDLKITEATIQSMDESPDDWYTASLLDTVHHGPRAAARSMLQKIADNAEAMDMANPITGTGETLEARSTGGKIRVTLNPGRAQGFRMPDPPVGFVQADPGTLEAATALIVPTTGNPGGIQPGHVLRYSKYDGKLETFQPEGTHFSHRVHPLTVRPRESESLNAVRAQADTTWVVVGRGTDYLALAPMSKQPSD